MKWHNFRVEPDGDASSQQRYLNINPEGVLFREAQDITEELGISKLCLHNYLSHVIYHHCCSEPTQQGLLAVRP